MDLNEIVTLPPDGGLQAWLQTLGSFLLLLNTFGIINSFGVFQTFYKEQLLADLSASSIAWIGSTQAFLLIALGVVAGPIYDRGLLRSLLVAGAICVVAGTLLLGLCTKYWQIILSQGLLYGLGAGCLFLPSIAILSQYFEKRLALATGIGSSGGAIGSVCYPILFNRLQPRIGFKHTCWIIALIMLVTLAPAAVLLRYRFRPERIRTFFEAKAWKEAPFCLWAAYLFTSLLGLYLPSFFIQLYGTNYMGKNVAFYLLPVLNSGSFFGRPIPLYVADRVGPLNVEIVLTTCAGVLAFIWESVQNTGGLFVFCAVYGFFAGATTTTTAPIDVSMCPNSDVVGVRMGMLLFPWAFGFLLSIPIGGALLSSSAGWLSLQVFSGSVLLLASCFAISTRLAKHGWTLKMRC